MRNFLVICFCIFVSSLQAYFLGTSKLVSYSWLAMSMTYLSSMVKAVPGKFYSEIIICTQVNDDNKIFKNNSQFKISKSKAF